MGVEMVKGAEDGKGVIVRLYESQRQREEATLNYLAPIEKATLLNLLKETVGDLLASGNRMKFSCQPCQIISIKVVA